MSKFDLFAFIAVCGFLVFCFITAINTPEVEYSWETKKCVRVVYMDGTTTNCDVLPDKYDKVWVK